MDPLVLAFLIAIVLMSGFIGVLADNLGRKFGKKRLRIFNLRPKHTARLGTFLAGVTVSIATIAVVFFASSDVRQWIVNGRESITKAQQLAVEVGVLKASVLQKKNQKGALDDQIEQNKVKIANTQKLLQESKSEANRQRLIAKRAELVAKESQIRVNAEKQKLNKVNKLLVKTNALITSTNLELKSATNSYNEINSQIQDSYKENRRLTIQNASLTTKLDALNKKISLLLEQQRQLNQQSEYLSGEVAKNEEKRKESDNALSIANGKLDYALAQVHQINSVLQATASSSRERKLIYARDDELGRVELPAELSPARAREEVMNLIRSSSDSAEIKGAGKFDHSDLSANFTELAVNGEKFTPDQLVDKLAQTIELKPDPIVLVCSSLLNTFEGEPVAVQIRPFNNPIIFTKGQLLGKLHVGRYWSVQLAVLQLNDFSTKMVAGNKSMSKLIPVEKNGESIVQVNPDNTYQAVDEIVHSSDTGTLSAVVSRDTRAGDVLSFTFVLK